MAKILKTIWLKNKNFLYVLILLFTFNNCKGNTKKLYQTLNILTGVKVENPLPEGKQDHELAEEFAEFFLSKIEKIRNNLQDVPLYCPTSERETNQVDEWQELSEGDVKKIITSLATVMFEL